MPLRYSDVRQKSSHNSFYHLEGIYDQFLYWRVHSLEFDINIEAQGSGIHDANVVEGDWFVYETPYPTNVNRLSDALSVLQGIHRSEPDHEVITIFLDLKDALEGDGHTPDRLDAAIEKFGASLAPADGPSAVYRASDHHGTWPTLDDLRGRFIFGLTGNDYLPAFRDYQDAQIAAGGTSCIFLAPEDGALEHVSSGADFVTAFQADWGQAAFANINFHTWKENPSVRDVASELAKVGIVSRAFPRTIIPSEIDDLKDPGDWLLAKQAGFHHIATNRINSLKDSFSSTNATNGYPFEVVGSSSSPEGAVGSRRVVSFRVDSGDIFGEEDSCAFLCRDFPGADANRRLIYFIASPNSSVESWAKGGLMARASLDPRADYFALVRPADDHPFQVQSRSRGYYKETSLNDRWVDENRIKAGGFHIKPDTLVYGRLDILKDGYWARAYAAISVADPLDETDWIFIAEQHFDVPLRFQGLAASSHGGGPVLFEFGDLGTDPPVALLGPPDIMGQGVREASTRINVYPS